MSFVGLQLMLLFFSLPPDVQAALDKLTFFDNVRLELVRHTNDSTAIQNARALFMRNRQGQELVINEPNFDGTSERMAKRSLMKDGLMAFSVGLAPGVQMNLADETPIPILGSSPEFIQAGRTLVSLEDIPTLQSFHLRGKLRPENVLQVTVESSGELETYHVLTDLKHHSEQDRGSTLSFVYDPAIARIVETWIRPGERCRIDYGRDEKITKLTLLYPGNPRLSRSWDVQVLETRDVPEDFDWRWIGLVTGSQVAASIPGHRTNGKMARWTGEDLVTMEEYGNLVAAGQVVTDPEYHRIMGRFMAAEDGKTYQTFEEAMADFNYRVAQSATDGPLTPWLHLTRQFCQEFSVSDHRRSAAEKTCEKATERLQKIAGEYNKRSPDAGLLTLMTLSQRALEAGAVAREREADPRRGEALTKSRELFVRFWEELRSGLPESELLRKWDQRFDYKR